MFEGFIFDVEGTLLDSVSQNQRSLQDALEKSGYRVPIQTLRLYSGLDGDQTLQLVVPDASGRERIAILEDRRKIYERDYLPSVRPLEGVRDVLRILVECGGRIALATDCKGVSFTRHMSLLDAGDYIAVTACGDDLEHGKPDPRLVGIGRYGVLRTGGCGQSQGRDDDGKSLADHGHLLARPNTSIVTAVTAKAREVVKLHTASAVPPRCGALPWAALNRLPQSRWQRPAKRPYLS